MSDSYNDLADFIRAKIKEKDLNYRLVADRSGGLITHSAVYDVISRRSIDQKISTLKGLALGLGESEEIIFALARGVKPKIERIANERFAKIADGYVQSTQEKRNLIEPILTAIEITLFNSNTETLIGKESDFIKVNRNEPIDDEKHLKKKKEKQTA